MANHQFKITIITCLVIAVIVIFVGQKVRQNEPQVPAYVTPIVNAEAPALTPVTSPDGKMTLIMKKEKGKDSTLFSFEVVDNTSGTKRIIYSKSLVSPDTISVPLNAFSPDNKYVFLKMGTGITNYLVMTTNGDPITVDLQNTEISALFNAKYENYKITDVTGWASPNLLVVNVDKVTSGEGSSFWFELPSQAFIQLSTRFN